MTLISLTTRSDPKDHNTSRVYVIGKTGFAVSHEAIDGAGSQGMAPFTFPEGDFINDSYYIGFKGQELKLAIRLNLLNSDNDLSVDTGGTSTAPILDPGGRYFPSGAVKTTDEQLFWLFIYLWESGMARQSWFCIDDLMLYSRCNNDHLIGDITNANPGVVTSLGHGFANNEIVLIERAQGMEEVNGRWFMVKNKTANTFQLYARDGVTPINTTGYGGYILDTGYVGYYPPGLPCVISDIAHGLAPRFSIDRKISVTINLNVGRNLA